MIARCTSNIGSALFRLERYKESIEKHKEALKVFIELKDKDREFWTKEYIIGASIKLWLRNHNDLSFDLDSQKHDEYVARNAVKFSTFWFYHRHNYFD